MRIMFMANAPWCTTGYGVQGKHLVPRLKALGHEVAYFSFYGLEGGFLEYDGVPIYPRALDMWGGDILPAHMAHFGAEVLITLMDVWVTPAHGKLSARHGWKWWPWTPIDHKTLPPKVKENLDLAHTILPYSQFGEDQLRENGYQNVQYCPHGVSDAYSPGDQAAARKRVGLPQDTFIIGIVAANKQVPSRKSFPEQMMAFKKFHRIHPDSLLYIHSMWTEKAGGINLKSLVEHLELEDSVIFTDQYKLVMGLSEPDMADLYRSFDLLSAAATNEGFGIPILEAQSCGIPVVTTHNTSMTELTWYGTSVEGQDFWTPLESWVTIPSIEAIRDAYLRIYDHRDSSWAVAERLTALQESQRYHWDYIISTYWKPLLENGGHHD